LSEKNITIPHMAAGQDLNVNIVLPFGRFIF